MDQLLDICNDWGCRDSGLYFSSAVDSVPGLVLMALVMVFSTWLPWRTATTLGVNKMASVDVSAKNMANAVATIVTAGWALMKPISGVAIT